MRNRLIIAQLSQRLQNTILLQSDVTDSRARAGLLQPRLAWRAPALRDQRVFLQRQQSELGELSVDILLDASASQNQQQEKLSTQAYLIAESLTRCQIPVRVSSFCSVSGCTVLRIFRDYNESGKNDAIFDYVSAGWNRDGLALRAMDWLMDRSPCDHRLFILLSDANPNDDQKIPAAGRFPKDYSGKAGVQDTADEAALLRRRGHRSGVRLYRAGCRSGCRPQDLWEGPDPDPLHWLVRRHSGQADPGPNPEYGLSKI